MAAFINAFIAYFVIVDPVGMTLVFTALTAGKDDAFRRRTALRAVLISTALVLCFGFQGARFLAVLGIEPASFKIAGGLLLFYSAFHMITQPDHAACPADDRAFEDISVFPLSIPFIAGPGCLTLTVLLFSTADESGESMVPLIAAIFAIYAVTFLCFIFAAPLVRLTGNTLNNVLKRLLGVLLASLAVQFVADGVRTFIG